MDLGVRSVPGVNLALATWVSAINFWAWNMIGPLSTTYAGQMSLSSTEASLLVATPILVGALGRIVSGALTDRFGGRTMFIAVSLASVIPVLAVGAAGSARSYPLLLVCGLFLGIAGTIFAVGIPFANNWYDPARRGFATGVFGMGMVGTALSAFFTPRFVNWFGLHRIPDGVVFVYHAQERTIDVPRTETNGNRGGIHNSLTRLLIKPSHLAGGYAQTAYAFNYLGPTGNQRDEVTVVRRRSQEVTY